MIQSRTITVVSGQPESSKWWWIGAIRKSRFPSKRRNTTICKITETVSITKRPPMIGNRRCVLVVRASAARPLPIASDPVSPMKIWAARRSTTESR